LYYYRARYYDAKAGRFASEDPVGLRAGVNTYRYVDDSPSNWRDPSGLTKNQPGQTTIFYICCKNGTIGICRGPQTLPRGDVLTCAVAHEEKHITDIDNDLVCKTDKSKCKFPVQNDEPVGPDTGSPEGNKSAKNNLECRAYCTELACLTMKGQGPEVRERVRYVQGQIQKYCPTKGCQ
jgi:hypothetical protein